MTPMRFDRDTVMDGLVAYLLQHFPDTEVMNCDDATTGNLILHATGETAFRLDVTERFLDADGGAARRLDEIRAWKLAQTIREAAGRTVTLTIDGPTIAPQP
jgi:hypothetical protein